jgi:hypothetical protein
MRPAAPKKSLGVLKVPKIAGEICVGRWNVIQFERRKAYFSQQWDADSNVKCNT